MFQNYTSESKVDILQSNIQILYKQTKDTIMKRDVYKEKYFELLKKTNPEEYEEEMNMPDIIINLRTEKHAYTTFKQIEQLMMNVKTAGQISFLLKELYPKIRSDMYYQFYFRLIDILTVKILNIPNNEEIKIDTEDKYTQERQNIIDFLFKLKDRFPFKYGYSGENCYKIFNYIMKFMYDNNLMPSKKLQQEYSQSEFANIISLSLEK